MINDLKILSETKQLRHEGEDWRTMITISSGEK